jgi:hypothetical protein
MALGGQDGIQQRDQVQAGGDIEQGRDVSEGGHLGFQRLRGLVGLLRGGDQVFDLAEVDLPNDLGLAVDALAVAGVVVGVAGDPVRAVVVII